MVSKTHGVGPDQAGRGLWRLVAEILVLGLAYAITARLGLLLAVTNPNVTAVWPPTAIALAGLLLLGTRVWPGIALGAIVANVSNGLPVHSALGIAVGNTLGPLIGAMLLSQVVRFRPSLDRVSDVLALIFLGGFAAMVLSATGGTMALLVTGAITSDEFWNTWVVWWLGDAAGVVLFAPVLLTLGSSAKHRRRLSGRPLELAVLLAIIGGVGWLAIETVLPITYLLIPPVVWAALRFLQPGAALSAVAAAAIVLWGDIGPGTQGLGRSTTTDLMIHQGFNVVVVLTAMCLAAVTSERERASGDLRRLATALEERVRERTEKLERSNRELEQFAYVASHDLRAPLLTIKGFLELLEERVEDQLDDEGRQLIRFVHRGTDRMEDLIRDLLAYAHVDTTTRLSDHVDTEEALAAALATMQADIAKSGAVITKSALPVITADAGQLAQVLQNLIANAIKFRRDPPPEIRVEAERLGSEWLFSVRDNGIGIDQAAADQIFAPFQRLHGHDRYEGTGIGLAICKRVIDRHGGRIWVEPSPGEGSTFFFTIPA